MGFPFEKQRDAMQCGVAALAMVCRFHGYPCTLQQLEQVCHPTRDGVSLKGISDAAKSLGFETQAAKLEVDSLTEVPLPCILHWNQNHFVVLYGVSRRGNRFRVADPAKGKTVYSREEFCRGWCGNAPAPDTSGEGEPEGRGIAMFLCRGRISGRLPMRRAGGGIR